METLNKDFWEKRDAAMKRFMASKERKRKRMEELEQMLPTLNKLVVAEQQSWMGSM